MQSGKIRDSGTLQHKRGLTKISFNIRASAVRVGSLLHRISPRCPPPPLRSLYGPDQRRRLRVGNNPTGRKTGPAEKSARGEREVQHVAHTPPEPQSGQGPSGFAGARSKSVPDASAEKVLATGVGSDRAPPHLFLLLCRSIFFLFRIMS